MPCTILPYAEKYGAPTDQQKRQNQHSDHAILDPVLNVQLKTFFQERHMYYQQACCHQQIEENKYVGESDGNIQQSNSGSADYNGIVRIQIVCQVIVAMTRGDFELLTVRRIQIAT